MTHHTNISRQTFLVGKPMMSTSTDIFYHNTDDYPPPVLTEDAWTYPSWFFSLARFTPHGPTNYGESVRMPAEMYLGRSVMGIISAGLTFLLVLLVILPIIKHRLESVIVAVNSVCIGAAISLCLVCPEWLYGCVKITSPMNYFHTQEVYEMNLGIHIGLACTNVTLESIILPPIEPSTKTSSLIITNATDHSNLTITTIIESIKPQPPYFFYNERLKMYIPELFEPEMGHALLAGYPVPLLTVYHFLTSATRGFSWSQDILEAGYHCYLLVIFALTVWFVTLVFIAAVPRYSCYAFVVIGCLLLFTNITYFYWVKLYHHFPPIYVGGEFVHLRYGICFWTCLVTGLWSCMYGFTLALMDVIYPDRFLSIFDLDFDHKCALAVAHRMNKKNGNSTLSLDVFKEEDEGEYHHYNFEL